MLKASRKPFICSSVKCLNDILMKRLKEKTLKD